MMVAAPSTGSGEGGQWGYLAVKPEWKKGNQNAFHFARAAKCATPRRRQFAASCAAFSVFGGEVRHSLGVLAPSATPAA